MSVKLRVNKVTVALNPSPREIVAKILEEFVGEFKYMSPEAIKTLARDAFDFAYEGDVPKRYRMFLKRLDLVPPTKVAALVVNKYMALEGFVDGRPLRVKDNKYVRRKKRRR